MPRFGYARRQFWLVLTASMFVAGSMFSIMGAKVVTRNDAQASRQSFATSSEEIASTLKLTIQNEQNLVVNTGAFFIDNRTPTKAQFRQETLATQTFARYPELIGIAEIIVVRASQLKAFEARELAGAAGTLGPGGTFQVEPPGPRTFYCFAAVAQSRGGPSTLPAGFDYCDTVLGPYFLKAEDSGRGAYYPYGAGTGEELVLGNPIYSTGFVPRTVQARRAAFIGWTGTQVSPRAILLAALLHHPKTAVALTYDDGTSKVSFKAGTRPPGAQSAIIPLQKGWSVETYGVLSGASVWSNAYALSLLLIGMLVSALLALLTFLLGTGRARALEMVHERTDQLQHQALHDSLTGLPNRSLILDRINQMLARVKRDHVAIAVLFLDLDNFKDINDTLGHAAGDQLLIKVGDRLSNVLRQADSVGRLGGDEFVILVEGPSLAPGAEAVAQRILDVMKTPFEIPASDVPLLVSASIGIAEGARATADDLLRDADIALYQAKGAGKQCVVAFVPAMQQDVDEHRQLVLDLNAGLERHQFFLLYQPTINLGTGAFSGVEALLRWRHPVRGVVLPEEFLSILESSGLIVPVGNWVLEEACRQGAAWRAQGHVFSISVNVSTKQLEHDRFIQDVAEILKKSGMEPGSLILEIAESSLMREVDVVIARLKALKDLGVHLAVDNFGTWYSSLSYLRQFPIDILKIDRSFVSGILDTKEAAALVHTLVELGRALGLETVAEGVENHEQRRLLMDENVDTAQGFFFAQPLDVAGVDQLLREWNPEPVAH